jgi:hypothetical protein
VAQTLNREPVLELGQVRQVPSAYLAKDTNDASYGHYWIAYGTAAIWRPTQEIKMKESHNKAADLHESAAKSHRAAAESHDRNDHAKGREHATQAQQHAQSANEQSKTANMKSAQQK